MALKVTSVAFLLTVAAQVYAESFWRERNLKLDPQKNRKFNTEDHQNYEYEITLHESHAPEHSHVYEKSRPDDFDEKDDTNDLQDIPYLEALSFGLPAVPFDLEAVGKLALMERIAQFYLPLPDRIENEECKRDVSALLSQRNLTTMDRWAIECEFSFTGF